MPPSIAKFLAATGVAAAAFVAPVAQSQAPAQAQDYPSRPIRIVVPFSPGGAVDGPTRVIAQELAKRLRQQVIVDNKPGAGATIGSEMVAKAAPDGYTLLLASQTNAIINCASSGNGSGQHLCMAMFASMAATLRGLSDTVLVNPAHHPAHFKP